MKDDTDPRVAERYRRMIRALSPQRRHAMGAQMLATAKALARAGIVAELPPGASEGEIRRRLFLRFYGDEIPEPHRSRIAAKIAARAPHVR